MGLPPSARDSYHKALSEIREKKPKVCRHKYVFKNNESYKRSHSRYSMEYASMDYFYCEKCLHEEVKIKHIILNDHEISDKLPEWAKTITKKIAGYE